MEGLPGERGEDRVAAAALNMFPPMRNKPAGRLVITTGDESVRGGQGDSGNSGLSYPCVGSTGGIFPAGANPTWGKQGSRDATGKEQGGSAGTKRDSQARKKRSGAEGCSLRGVGAALASGRGLAERLW